MSDDCVISLCGSRSLVWFVGVDSLLPVRFIVGPAELDLISLRYT